MKNAWVAICAAVFLLALPCFAQDQARSKADEVKNRTKVLADIKRQIRLMRAEMADLEEKIEQITGLHDTVYPTEKGSEESKQSEESQSSE